MLRVTQQGRHMCLRFDIQNTWQGQAAARPGQNRAHLKAQQEAEPTSLLRAKDGPRLLNPVHDPILVSQDFPGFWVEPDAIL